MTDRFGAGLPIVVLALILLCGGWIYWPGHAGPALLDDRSSVLVISNLKQNPELAWDFVFGNRSGPLGRPVSMASFVMEQLFLDGTLATSKKTSIVLHLFNGGLVMWLFWMLFRHIAVPGYRWLAVVLGAAWLLSPLYVSTVLYVVQRMAMLSTTFMLLACLSYLGWREQLLAGRFSLVRLLLVISSIVLAVFAKENAILVIPVLLLIEALWFQFAGTGGQKVVWLQSATLAMITLGGLAVVVFVVVNYEGLAAGFQRRDFTLEERLLTQSRVVWHYVAQMYAPDLFGMGIYHDDVVISTSYREPLSTSYALVAWICVLLIFLAMLRWRSGRYLALGIAWFLVGHSVESTVLSLELYFEHRNYFPGIGLFLFLGVLYAQLVRHWPEIRNPLLAYLVCYVLWLASLTGSQVQVWSSHPLLMLHHLNGHPDSFRANADMAVQMANLGQFEAAQQYSAKAYSVGTGERIGDHDIRDLALACIANHAVTPEQIAGLGTENPERPFGSVVTVHTLVSMLQGNACPEFDREHFANRMAELFLTGDSQATASANMYLGFAMLENTLRRWENANAYADLVLQHAPKNVEGMLMKLHFVTALGKVEEADTVSRLLLEMRDRGELTVGEQQTLSLYLEK